MYFVFSIIFGENPSPIVYEVSYVTYPLNILILHGNELAYPQIALHIIATTTVLIQWCNGRNPHSKLTISVINLLLTAEEAIATDL